MHYFYVGKNYISTVNVFLSCRTLWRRISGIFQHFDFQNLEMHLQNIPVCILLLDLIVFHTYNSCVNCITCIGSEGKTQSSQTSVISSSIDAKTSAFQAHASSPSSSHKRHVSPYEFAPSAVTHRNMDAMFDDYLNHLVLNDALSTIAPSDLSTTEDHI